MRQLLFLMLLRRQQPLTKDNIHGTNLLFLPTSSPHLCPQNAKGVQCLHVKRQSVGLSSIILLVEMDKNLVRIVGQAAMLDAMELVLQEDLTHIPAATASHTPPTSEAVYAVSVRVKQVKGCD